jgi:hypothetical protein
MADEVKHMTYSALLYRQKANFRVKLVPRNEHCRTGSKDRCQLGNDPRTGHSGIDRRSWRQVGEHRDCCRCEVPPRVQEYVTRVAIRMHDTLYKQDSIH